MRLHAFFGKCALAAFATLAPLGAAHAGFSVLHAFTGGRDGTFPATALIRDKEGNLYGTTEGGGSSCSYNGCGIIFKLAPDGRETVLHRFTGENGDGVSPSGVIKDSAGNLYGTAGEILFKLAPDGTETILYTFQGHGQKDGTEPSGGVIRDASGNLYGTTSTGGGTGCYSGYGCGTIYKLAPDGTETVLYSFTGGSDGEYPGPGVIMDKVGNLFGITYYGGSEGRGLVYKLDPRGTQTVLHTFTGGSDGAGPYAGVIKDEAGNLYGTTESGGNGCLRETGCGIVFKLAPDGTEIILHAFAGGSDGTFPMAGLIRDRSGNLYGTTAEGGSGCPEGCGTVFKLTPNGTETVLYAFHDRKRGRHPQATLMQDETGDLFGTTYYGGLNTDCYGLGCGIVFRLKK